MIKPVFRRAAGTGVVSCAKKHEDIQPSSIRQLAISHGKKSWAGKLKRDILYEAN